MGFCFFLTVSFFVCRYAKHKSHGRRNSRLAGEERTNTSSSTLGSKICHSDIGIDIDARFSRQPGDEIVGLTLEVGRIWEVGGGGHGWGEEEERIGEGRMREQKKERRRGG